MYRREKISMYRRKKITSVYRRKDNIDEDNINV